MPNNLLRYLGSEDLAAIEPHLTEVSLTMGMVLAEPAEDMRQVYFPHAGIVSFMVALEDGALVQTLMVGSDGLVGAPQALDDRTSINKIVVQVAGSASAIRREQLRRLVEDRPRIRQLLAAHEQFVVADIQQTAACNAKHSIEQRCARWLMRMRDLVGDDLPITQEYLADMIGVRRSSVTKLAGNLQQSGAISYVRGKLQVTDATRLRASSCECHQAVRDNYESLFGRPWPRVRSSGREVS